MRFLQVLFFAARLLLGFLFAGNPRPRSGVLALSFLLAGRSRPRRSTRFAVVLLARHLAQGLGSVLLFLGGVFLPLGAPSDEVEGANEEGEDGQDTEHVDILFGGGG